MPIFFSYEGTSLWSSINEPLNFSFSDQLDGAHNDAAPRKYFSSAGSIKTRSS
ncbi:uncharacterized protein METZ01_LOCUS7749 [marine metagenome]|uniref:Uncharacterized protein n=1 Tax=marine metagenome TaxID=408172 RepID=A0A381NK14_9ZZZZ